MTDLAQVLADARGDASVLRRSGNVGQAEYLDRLLDRFRDASEGYRTWLSEPEAMLKSGLSQRTLRRRFRELVDCTLARHSRERGREYLACAIPQKPDIHAAHEDGLREPTEGAA